MGGCVGGRRCRGRGRAAIGQPLGGGLHGAADLGHQAAEMRLLDQVETAGAVLRREVPLIDRLADKGPIRRAGVALDFRHRQDFIDDARQLEAGLRAVDLRLEDAPIEVVELLVEDPDEPDVLRPRVLQMGQPRDHLAAVQAVGAAHIGLAGLVRKRVGLPLAPLEAEPPGDGDRVDEDRVVALERSRIAEALAHRREVGLAVDLVVPQRRIGAADEDREVAALGPCARPDAVAGPSLDGEVARLQVDEQCSGGVERPEKRGLADPGLAEDRALDAARLGKTLIGGDDREGHHLPPFVAIRASIATSAPSAPALRASS